jgi:hypothetical protein
VETNHSHWLRTVTDSQMRARRLGVSVGVCKPHQRKKLFFGFGEFGLAIVTVRDCSVALTVCLIVDSSQIIWGFFLNTFLLEVAGT